MSAMPGLLSVTGGVNKTDTEEKTDGTSESSCTFIR